jgi:hypothetical protein
MLHCAEYRHYKVNKSLIYKKDAIYQSDFFVADLFLYLAAPRGIEPLISP